MAKQGPAHGVIELLCGIWPRNPGYIPHDLPEWRHDRADLARVGATGTG
jgi:hypothetical protein